MVKQNNIRRGLTFLNYRLRYDIHNYNKFLFNHYIQSILYQYIIGEYNFPCDLGLSYFALIS